MNWLEGWKRLRWIVGVIGTVAITAYGLITRSGTYTREMHHAYDYGPKTVHYSYDNLAPHEMAIWVAAFWLVIFFVHKPAIWVINGLRSAEKHE